MFHLVVVLAMVSWLSTFCWLHKNRYQEWSLKAAMDTLNMGILWLAVIFCCYHGQWMRLLLHWWFTLPISFTNTLGLKFFRRIWRQRVRCWWLGGHVELFQVSVVAPCCRGRSVIRRFFRQLSELVDGISHTYRKLTQVLFVVKSLSVWRQRPFTPIFLNFRRRVEISLKLVGCWKHLSLSLSLCGVATFTFLQIYSWIFSWVLLSSLAV